MNRMIDYSLVHTDIFIYLLSFPKNFGGGYSRRFVRSSVRTSVHPVLVRANSQQQLVFQRNFIRAISIEGGYAYHLYLLI